MFKLFFCILLVFFVASKANEINWYAIPSSSNSSQCIFRPQANDLTCRGASNTASCQAAFENSFIISFGLDIFGISREPNRESKMEMMKFRIYPRQLENQSYFDFNFTQHDQRKELYLYHRIPSENCSGIRVVDLFCWFKLINILEESSDENTIKTLENTVDRLIGEILIAKKPAQKNWIGWAVGWNSGWGWGLNGWGLPLWGLPWIA